MNLYPLIDEWIEKKASEYWRSSAYLKGVPAVVSKRGVQAIRVGSLPKRLMLHVMVPRMLRMEQILQAFLEGDRRSLLLMLMEDYGTKEFENAKALIDELLAQPWNTEAFEHYKW